MAEAVPEDVLVLIKSTTNRSDFSLLVPLNSTIADLKKLLHVQYEGNPAPADQTVRKPDINTCPCIK